MEECFATELQRKIDSAAKQVVSSHPKWPLVADTVRIPSGVYKVRRPIRLRSGVAVRGEHQASVVFLSELENEDPVFYSEPEDELYATSVSGIHARSEKHQQGVFLRVFSANRNCSFGDLFIENFGHSIVSEECYTSKFHDIGVYRCGEGPQFYNLTNGRLYNIKTENCAGNGLYLGPSKNRTDSVSGTDVTGYVAQGNGRCGVLIDRVDQVRFASLFLEGNNRQMMRADGDNGDYAQLRLIGDRNVLNKRNSNVFFDNIFVTPGRSDLTAHAAIQVLSAEVVIFRGGVIRNNQNVFSRAFEVSDEVLNFVAEDLVFDRWKEDKIFNVKASTSRIESNFYSGQSEPPILYQAVGH